MGHGIRCGPKVLAEKAKYHSTKVVSTVGGERVETIETVSSDSAQSTTRVEMHFSQREDSSSATVQTNYAIPSSPQLSTDTGHFADRVDLPFHTEDFEQGNSRQSD